MTEPNYQVYDFASSARVDRPLWIAFNRWLQKFSELFVEHWENFSAEPIQGAVGGIDAHPFARFQLGWDQPAYGVEISFNNESLSGLLIIERVDLLKMLVEILGNADGELEDRELTPIESSLGAMIFEQAVATLAESWPEQESLSFKIGKPFEQPNRSRLFASDKVLLETTLSVQLTSNTALLQILLSKDEATRILNVEEVTASPVNPTVRVSRDRIAEIHVKVSAGLGTTDLALTDLVSLSVGDIILLDQCVTEPVTLFANEEPIFQAWPGRVSNKLALKIVSPLS